MHQLGKLIQRIQDENGWSNVDVANRAIERGHSTSKQSIGEYKNKPVKSIGARQIHLLAEALGVAPMTVVRAAAESMGIQDHLEGEDELTTVVRTTTDLSERDKRLVMSLLNAMRTDESSEHAPHTHEQDPPALRALKGEDADTEDAGVEQKTELPDPELLAAHPDMPLAADQDDEYFDQLGEESQARDT
jgi:hypothetical protein